MRVRRLTVAAPNGSGGFDRSFGHGLADFWIDMPDGVAQCAQTRLLLWFRTWFLDRTAGVPYLTKVLGKYTGQTRDPVIQATILGTQGVKALLAYSSEVNPNTRAYTVNATANTIYGNFQFGATIPASG